MTKGKELALKALDEKCMSNLPLYRFDDSPRGNIIQILGGMQPVRIQVRATKRNKPRWVLSEKEETPTTAFPYIFVHNKPEPEFYFGLSTKIADAITNGHSGWLNTPGRNGQKHKNNPMRVVTLCSDTPSMGWANLTALILQFANTVNFVPSIGSDIIHKLE